MATPSIYARGKYEVLAPFALVPDVSYTAIAIRSFRDVQAEGIDIFAAYYEPKGLDRAKYDTDRVNAVSLVTLAADEHPQVIIPTSYIKTVPLSVGTGFSRMVLAVDIGVLPDSLDLSYLNAEIKSLVSDLTGLTEDVEVKTYTAPVTGLLTPEQAEAFEQNRLAAIKGRATFYAHNKQLEEELVRLREINARYEKIIIDNSLLS